MKIIHHNDDDGRLAAAIVKLYISGINFGITENDCIEYNHGWDIEMDYNELAVNETVYIVDIAMNDVIYKIIKDLISMDHTVIHIDHHKSGIDYYNKLSNEEKEYLSNNDYIQFFREGVSGSLLTWIYKFIIDKVKFKSLPGLAEFDFTEKRTHFRFNDDNNDIYIPDIIRYVDDNDVWLHDIPETKYFTLGFRQVKDKNPCSDIWIKAFANERGYLDKFISDGKIIYEYEENSFKLIMRNAFTSTFPGFEEYKCRCVNTSLGNSRLFGDDIYQYPFVCKYSYDGSINKWRYALYSSEKAKDCVDVAKVATAFGGGGHPHAAGCILDVNLFNE